MTQERMSADQFRKLYGNNSHPRPQLPHAKPQCDHAQPLGQTKKAEAGSMERIVLRIEGRRVKTLDPDNFSGGCKALIDGLRASKLLLDDSSEHITLETSQTKVSHFYEEKTIVTLIYP